MPEMNHDELLQPTVTEAVASHQKPWRLGSQFWVAFFGGVLAITVISVINASRLGVPRSKRNLMIVICVAALAGLLVAWLQRPPDADLMKFYTTARELRLYSRIAAVAVYVIFAALQRQDDVRYRLFSNGEYASLWGPGLAAALLLGTIQPLALAAIAWLSR